MNYRLVVYVVWLSNLYNKYRDNMIVFIENLIQKKDNIKYIIIEAHGYSDISIVRLCFDIGSQKVLA
jgi:hypothetical protein